MFVCIGNDELGLIRVQTLRYGEQGATHQHNGFSSKPQYQEVLILTRLVERDLGSWFRVYVEKLIQKVLKFSLLVNWGFGAVRINKVPHT